MSGPTWSISIVKCPAPRISAPLAASIPEIRTKYHCSASLLFSKRGLANALRHVDIVRLVYDCNRKK